MHTNTFHLITILYRPEIRILKPKPKNDRICYNTNKKREVYDSCKTRSAKNYPKTS